MHANNETGVIQPIAQVADLVHAAGGLLHVDAVQAAGKIPCDIKALGADFMTLSAHKLGGPKGVGALIKARDALHIVDPLIRGGGQERGARAGTENVIGISRLRRGRCGGAGVLWMCWQSLPPCATGWSARWRDIAPDDGDIRRRIWRALPNTTLFAVPGLKAETALIALDLAGVAVSSGSACSSGKVAALACARRDGRRPALAAVRDPRQPRADHHAMRSLNSF